MRQHALGGEFDSLVAVKAKAGELEALSHMDRTEIRRVQPVVELLSTVAGNDRVLGRLAAVAMLLAEHGRSLLLDVCRLARSSPLWRMPQGPFGYVSSALEDHLGLHASQVPPFVPVVALDATDREYAQVTKVLEHLGHGTAALRITGASRPLPHLPEALDRALRLLRLDIDRTDLLLDVGFLERAPAGQAVRMIAANLRRLPSEHCRSVTLLGGSIPLKRRDSTTRQPRHEYALWHRLLTRMRALRYGDYGVVHPFARDDPSVFRRPPRHPYLHYTCFQASHFFTRRLPRESPEEEAELKRRKFGELALEVTERYPQATTAWGDRLLRRCAHTGGSAEAARWVAIATSHHLGHLAAHGDLLPEDRPERS